MHVTVVVRSVVVLMSIAVIIARVFKVRISM
jgi:hypothetical protein